MGPSWRAALHTRDLCPAPTFFQFFILLRLQDQKSIEKSARGNQTKSFWGMSEIFGFFWWFFVSRFYILSGFIGILSVRALFSSENAHKKTSERP
jgi:hypothetical protein